jgi:hypothetical protein
MYLTDPPVKWTKNTITSPVSKRSPSAPVNSDLAAKYGKLWKRIWLTSKKKPVSRTSPASASLSNLEAQLELHMDKNKNKNKNNTYRLNGILQNLYVPKCKATSPCVPRHVRNVDPTLNMEQMFNLRVNPLYRNSTPEKSPVDERARLKEQMAKYLVFKNVLTKKK